MLTLIFGRVVQGCGAGGLVVTANMVLGDIAAPKERGRYYTYFSIAFTTAGGSGPALGGMDFRALALADDLFVEFSIMRCCDRDRADRAAPPAAAGAAAPA
jgi:MFS family permease